jgi:hypothetical protein
VISFVQVLANLVDVKYIKCIYKVGNLSCYFRDLKKKMNSTKVLILTKVHFNPPFLNLI